MCNIFLTYWPCRNIFFPTILNHIQIWLISFVWEYAMNLILCYALRSALYLSMKSISINAPGSFEENVTFSVVGYNILYMYFWLIVWFCSNFPYFIDVFPTYSFNCWGRCVKISYYNFQVFFYQLFFTINWGYTFNAYKI